MELPRRYAYRTKWWRFAFGVMFFGLAFFCGLMDTLCTDMAKKPDVWFGKLILTVTMAWYALMSGTMLVRWSSGQRFLELRASELILPHGFMLNHETRIPYGQIERIYERYSLNAGLRKVLWLKFNGRKLAVMSSRFSDPDGYPEVREFLYSQMNFHSKNDTP